MKAISVFGIVLATAAALPGSQFTYSNSGGIVTQTTSLSMTGVTLSSPAGTMSMSCPLTDTTPQYPYYSQWTCIGGSLSLQSTNGGMSITGAFTSGLFSLQKKTSGASTSYDYLFYGTFAGSQTANGHSSAVVGSVSETLAALGSYLGSGTIQTGLIDVSRQLEPVYIADTGNNRIVQTADILGSNWASLGQSGSGVKQFSAPWGIALDAAGKIYISDSGNCRIVRVDNIQGANWTSYGACGSGAGQFSNPQGLAVDSSGKIYIADSGNNRIVRLDNITGAGFLSLGTLGNGTNQFSAPSAVTTDSAGNIYVADSANARIIEVADMSGTNWTALQFNLLYFPFTTSGVTVDSAGRIYTTDSDQSQFVRVDNITGANMITLTINYGNYIDDPSHPTGVFVDPDGAAYLADTGNNRVERYFDMSFNDVFLLGTSGTGTGNLSQPHAVVALSESKRAPLASVTPAMLPFPTELVGVASPAQSAVLTNIGTAPFTVNEVTSSSPDFTVTHNCPSSLAGGQSCAATATFQPTAGGMRKGTVSFALAGTKSKTVYMSGSGALVTLSTNELIMFDCANGSVTVTNPLSTSTSLESVKTSAGFSETNNCSTLAPGASCTITVHWCSGTPITGTLAVKDISGTVQFVSMTGE